MRILLLIALYFLIPFNGFAQTWEVGGFIGGSGYMGDINPVKPYKISDLAFGGQIKRNLDGHWALKLNAMHGTIGADDLKSSNAYQRERGINFKSPITELSLQVEFNFFNYFPGSLPGDGTRRATPYLFTGIGGLHFNPKAYYEVQGVKEEYLLADFETETLLGAEKYKRLAISVPYGAGLKYNVKGNWNIIGEVGYRTAFTDYLDDVSGNYPTDLSPRFTMLIRDVISDPSPNQIGIPGGQRGDFRKRDTYMFMGISLTYTLVPIKCPTF